MNRETRVLEQVAEEASHLRDELAAIAQGVDYDERTAAAPDPELRELVRRLSRCADRAGLVCNILDDVLEVREEALADAREAESQHPKE